MILGMLEHENRSNESHLTISTDAASEGPVLTIIVPVYNVEPYIRKALDSILAQTFTGFETILVDDGSTDGSELVIDEYAARDSRMVVLHQANAGVSAARNAGLAIAQGAYVGFIDADDWIDQNMYEALIKSMVSSGSDIAMCSVCSERQDGSDTTQDVGYSGTLDAREFTTRIFERPRRVQGSVLDKLFLREKINVKFDLHQRISEDRLFLVSYCVGIEKACFTPDASYHVFERYNSATRKDNRVLTYGLPVARRLIDVVNPLGRCVQQEAEADFLDICVRCLRMAKDEKDSEYYRAARAEFLGYLEHNLLRAIGNSRINWKAVILGLGYVLGVL